MSDRPELNRPATASARRFRSALTISSERRQASTASWINSERVFLRAAANSLSARICALLN